MAPEKQEIENEGSMSPKEASNHTNEQEPPLVENNSLEQWNYPKINIYRYLSAIFSFIIMGMNDAAPGVSSHAILTQHEANYQLIDLRH